MKKILSALLVLTLFVSLFSAFGAWAEEAEEEEENYLTGDASLDDPLNQDGIGEKELLVVSFGTSFNDSRRLTIGAVEKELQRANPSWSVRRAFTSQIIIDHVKDRDGEVIDNVTEALERAIANGVKTLVVQPTHLMPGFEYHDLEAELAEYADAFDTIVLSEPLLYTDADISILGTVMIDVSSAYALDRFGLDEFQEKDARTAYCFMGHGTEADSNAVYARLQDYLFSSSVRADNIFVGTVEAEPSVQDVLEMVQAGDYDRVVLRPLMIVAGDHANNDMAGDDEDSWKSIFEAAGYEVDCVLEGLGSNDTVQFLFDVKASDAIARAGK